VSPGSSSVRPIRKNLAASKFMMHKVFREVLKESFCPESFPVFEGNLLLIGTMSGRSLSLRSLGLISYHKANRKK